MLALRILTLLSLIFILLSCSGKHPGAVESPVSEQPAENHLFLKSESADAYSMEAEENRQKLLDVPLIKQLPELRYGCEVTSTAMLLQFAGINVSKMDLYETIRKDPDQLVRKNGDILKWGNPDDGFVGDMPGKGGRAGYAAFDGVIEDLINQYLPERAINLTGETFDRILDHVKNGYPVVIWTTGDYRLPDRWEEWEHEGETVKTPLDLHVVVLVGFDDKNVYLNDPLSGKKQAKVNKNQFIASWKALKMRAVSYY